MMKACLNTNECLTENVLLKWTGWRNFNSEM